MTLLDVVVECLGDMNMIDYDSVTHDQICWSHEDSSSYFHMYKLQYKVDMPFVISFFELAHF